MTIKEPRYLLVVAEDFEIDILLARQRVKVVVVDDQRGRELVAAADRRDGRKI